MLPSNDGSLVLLTLAWTLDILYTSVAVTPLRGFVVVLVFCILYFFVKFRVRYQFWGGGYIEEVWWLNHWRPEAEFMSIHFNNLIEVSGHNLESSQTWGFCMDFLNHREGGMVFCQGFPPFSFKVYSNWTVETVRGCVILQKNKPQGEDVEVTVNSMEENYEDFCLDFIQEFGLRIPVTVQ